MPTNVSTSFFFINLLFQARRAGSNPRPSCIPRCVAARDKSRPGRRAMARAHQEGCARARGVAGRGLEKPGILRGAWPHGTSRARGSSLSLAPIKRVAHVRGLVPGFSIRGAWPHGTSCARGGGLMARAYRESCVRARGVAGQGLEGLSHGGSLAGRSASGLVKIPALDGGKALCWGFLSRLGGAETVLSGTVSSLALPKNWMQKTQEYQ